MRQYHTSNSFRVIVLTFVLTLFLAACGGGGGYQTQPWKDKAPPADETPSSITAHPAPEVESEALDPQAAAETAAPVKVAILLPLSGQQANLGESMLRASEMALFDIGDNSFELMPRDTKGTPDGAAAAARDALRDGAKLVIGPVFANEVKSVQPITQAAGISLIPFSTDWTLARRGTYLIGFLPFDQVERVVRYATASGYKKLGVLSPSDTYGNAVVSAYDSISRQAGVYSSKVERLPILGNQFPAKVQAFGTYAQTSQIDAVLLPLGGNTAKQVAGLLTQNGLEARNVKRLGTGLMDDPALAADPNLNGAWFAAPSPQSRKKFEQRYGNTYSIKPMRLASLAYDATALAAVLARNSQNDGTTNPFNHDAITNPNGFSGVDGIFRFRPDGISERGLAVLEFNNGQINTIDEAPDTFQALSQ